MIERKDNRTFVGFGFGAIQAGLFLYEAQRSGAFTRLIVGDVVPETIMAVRNADGYFTINVAHSDRVECVRIGPITILDCSVESDSRALIEAVQNADEIATALPSVNSYTTTGAGSIHRILAQGLRRKVLQEGPRAVVYTSENHNHAAELLKEAVFSEIPANESDAVLSSVAFVNTVIGKMSGVVSDPEEMSRQQLVPITRHENRAFLVEAFNRILISNVAFSGQAATKPHTRGLDVFEEKPDLLPYEEAKLYGHNAAHALAAFIAAFRGVERIADVATIPGVRAFLRTAFIEESGKALIKKYSGLDTLFTRQGFAAYADDLLDRMTNPFLGDTVERVARDPRRKLEWGDRLVGTMRLAMDQDLTPEHYALGAAAAVAAVDSKFVEAPTHVPELLAGVWREAFPDSKEAGVIIGMIQKKVERLRAWRDADFPDLAKFFASE